MTVDPDREISNKGITSSRHVVGLSQRAVVESIEAENERLLYEKKSNLLRRSLKVAQEMDEEQGLVRSVTGAGS
jgi:hypothetical protein